MNTQENSNDPNSVTTRVTGGFVAAGVVRAPAKDPPAVDQDDSSAAGTDDGATIRPGGSHIPAFIRGPARGADARTQRPEGDVIQARAHPSGTTHNVGAGAVIQLMSGEYMVRRTLGTPSGEAEVFLVEKDQERFAFKYYFSHVKPNVKVLSLLQERRHQGVISLIEYGIYLGRTYELLEYAAGGNLTDVGEDGLPKYIPIRDEARFKGLVARIVDAMSFFHEQGVVHNDIKPANFFSLNSAGTDIRIADFGLAAMLSATGKLITEQNRTAVYAAPEIYRTVATGEDSGKIRVGKEVDYYALGMSLLHIWEGRSPFEGKPEFVSMNVKAEGNVEISAEMPMSLARLIRGLITVVPKHRWGFTEVQRWLKNEHVQVYEDVHVTQKQFPPLNLGNIDGTGRDAIVKSPAELAEVLLKDPQRAVQYLYQGMIANWVRDVDPPLHSDLMHLVEEEFPVRETFVRERSSREAAAVHKAVYILDFRRPFRTKNGKACNTSQEIGSAMEDEREHYMRAMTDPLDPLYLFFEARRQAVFADELRRYVRHVTAKRAASAEQAFNEIVLALQGWKTLRIDGEVFRSPGQMLAAPPATRDRLAQQIAAGDHTKAARWLSNVMHDDPTWTRRLARWRELERFSGITLSYLLDNRAAFDFNGVPVFTPGEFLAQLSSHIDARAPQAEFCDPASAFAQEADFWLSHYAHHADPSDSEVDRLAHCGYAEILQQYVANNKATLSPEVNQRIGKAIVEPIERRFRNSEPHPARRAGIETLARVNPAHALGGLFETEAGKARTKLSKEKQKRISTARALGLKQYVWLGVAGAAALFLPMITAWLVQPIPVSYLPLAVQITGTLAMGYGLFRAIKRQNADEEGVKEEARFITLIIGGLVLTLISVIVFLGDVFAGDGGIIRNFIGLILACAAGIVLSYAAGYLNALIAARWYNLGEDIRKLPPPREDLDEADYGQVLDAVALQWKQRPPAAR